jgi:hypothetical protein
VALKCHPCQETFGKIAFKLSHNGLSSPGLTGHPLFRNAGDSRKALPNNGFLHSRGMTAAPVFSAAPTANRSSHIKLFGELRTRAAMKTKNLLIRADARRFFG